jgi:transcriptional regulator with XRE-family HTH domain
MGSYYRRVRNFLGLHIRDVSAATGVNENRLRQIEGGRRLPNFAERELIERFLRDKLRAVMVEDGPFPLGLRLGS